MASKKKANSVIYSVQQADRRETLTVKEVARPTAIKESLGEPHDRRRKNLYAPNL
jgi:hypothetical protein